MANLPDPLLVKPLLSHDSGLEMRSDQRPLPLPDGRTSFFWDAAARGCLVIQCCTSCGYLQHPPEVACTECQGIQLHGVEVSGRGKLYSFAVAERAFHPGFVDHLPYVVGLVELVERPGLHLMSNIVESDPGQLSVGMPLQVVFEERGKMSLPQFRPAPRAG